MFDFTSADPLDPLASKFLSTPAVGKMYENLASTYLYTFGTKNARNH